MEMASSDETMNKENSKLISDIKECIQTLLKEFKETGIPINDDNATLHCFWTQFELLLETEPKEKSRILNSRRSYWDYFIRCLTSKSAVHDAIKCAISINEVKTSLGRGRAFIRYCLMNKCLADVLQESLNNEAKTRAFFNKSSLLLESQHALELVSTLNYLNEIQFDLPLAGNDLDVDWPASAKTILNVPDDQASPSGAIYAASLESQSDPERDLGEVSNYSEQNTTYSEPSESLTNNNIDINPESSEGLQASFAKVEMNMTDDSEATIERGSETVVEHFDDRETLTADVKELQSKVCKDEATPLLNEQEKLKDVADETKVTKELEWLRVEVKRLSDENIRFDEECTQLTEHTEKLKKCIATCNKKISAKERITENLESQVSALKEVAAFSKELMNARTNEANRLRTEICELKEKQVPTIDMNITLKLAALETENLELKLRVTDLMANIENLKQLLDDKANTLRQKDEAFAEMERIIKTREDTVLELEIRLSRLHVEINNLSVENENLKSNIEKLNVVVKEIKAAEDKLEKLEDDEKKANTDDVRKPSKDDDEKSDNASSTIVNFVICDQPNAFSDFLVFDKTLKRLKRLITEKQDLQLKLKSSYDLNTSLISKVKEQESVLSSVTFELSQTKTLIEQLKSAHSKLQTSEAILHYELKEKRSVVEQMKRMLESSRSQWLRARQKQSESEIEWQNLRADFASRIKQDSMESGYNEDSNVDKDRTEPLSPVSLESPSTSSADIPALSSEINDDTHPLQASSPATVSENEDLSASQDEEDEYSSDAPSVASPSRTKIRLQLMEEQCRLLYSRLVTSLRKSEFLEWKLSHLHKEHGGDTNSKEESSDATESENQSVQPVHVNEINKKFEILFVPYSDCNLKKAHSDSDELRPREVEFSMNDNEEINDENSELALRNDVEEDDSISQVEPKMIEASLTEEVEIYKPIPLTLAQALPKRVELLRKSKEDLEKNLQHMIEQQKETEAREAIRISELDELRVIVEELESTVQSLELEKTTLVQRETEFKKRARYIMRKEREERDNRYEDLIKIKEDLEEKNAALRAQLEDEENRNKELEEKYHKCTLEASSLRCQLASETIKHKEIMAKSEEHNVTILLMKDQITAQEQIIKNLQQQYNSIKEDLEIEKEQQNMELKDKIMSLMAREEECAELNEVLKETTRMYDERGNELLRLTAELETAIADKNKLEAELQLCQNDITNLKQRIVQLTKDKDFLWKRSEHLLYLHKMQSRENWMKDDEVTHCLGCNLVFSIMLRKHHCRLCGRIFCNKCSNNWSVTPSHSRKVRVCNDCVSCQLHWYSLSSPADGAKEQNENCSETEDEDNVVKEAGTSEDQAENVTASSSNQPTVVPPQNTSFMKRLFSSWSGSSKNYFQDEEFIVISDEEISRSLSYSSPYAPSARDSSDPNTYLSPMQNIEELVPDPSVNYSREIWINAGKSYSLPIKFQNQTSVIWAFSCEPKRIEFKLVRLFEDEMMIDNIWSEDLLTSVETSVLSDSHGGKLNVKKPGIYSFLFDNTHARFIAKKVIFTLMLAKYSEEENENSTTDDQDSTSLTQESRTSVDELEEQA